MLHIENISKSYARGSVKAVDSLTLDVNNGEIFGFLGPNGAGKTTTIKMMTGILPGDSGNIEIDNISIQKSPLEAKMKFSFVPDNPESFSRLKAAEYLNFVGDIYGVSVQDRKKRIQEYAELFGIQNVLSARISSFSHGMKQKLFLTASLLSNPSNWILDEPMVGLDPEAAFNLKEIMRRRADTGKTVFFSTHVMEVAEKLCTRLGIINRGRIIFTGTIDDLRAYAAQQQAESAHTASAADTTGNIRPSSAADTADTAETSLEKIFLEIIRADNEQRGGVHTAKTAEAAADNKSGGR